jgi:hypothetical protein
MTQATNFGFPRTGPKSPTDAYTQLDDNLDAILSNHSGSSRPSYAEEGTIWADTSVSGVVIFKYFDGTNDREIYRVDNSGNFTYPPLKLTGELDLDGNAAKGLTSLNGGPLRSRNLLINGGFDVDQRIGVTIPAASSGYALDQFFITNNTDQSLTVSQVDNVLGSGAGKHKMQISFATAPTSGDVDVEQRLPGVNSVNDKEFIASAVVYTNGPAGSEGLSAKIIQSFGSGGSPSADVETSMTFKAGSPTTMYDADGTRRDLTVTVPSLSSKTIGTDGEDYLALQFKFTPRQSGNYEFSRVSFSIGDITNETDPFEVKSRHEVLHDCRYFFQTGFGGRYVNGTIYNFAGYLGLSAQPLHRTMRTVPYGSIVGSQSGVVDVLGVLAGATPDNITIGVVTDNSFEISIDLPGSTNDTYQWSINNANPTLIQFSSEIL